MVEDAQAENLRCFHKLVVHPQIGVAGAEVAAGMVVLCDASVYVERMGLKVRKWSVWFFTIRLVSSHN